MVDNILLKHEYSIKCLGVILDENLHIKLLENKIAKKYAL